MNREGKLSAVAMDIGKLKGMAEIKDMLIYMAESMNSMKLENERLAGKIHKESSNLKEEVRQLRQEIGIEKKKDRKRLEVMEERMNT